MATASQSASPTASMSDRGKALARTFAAAFAALAEHQKSHPAEYALLMEANGGHMRSAAPMAMLQPPPPPLSGVKVPTGPDSFYGVTALGANLVLVINEGRRDAALTLTPVQAEAFVRDVASVAAGIEAGRG